MTDFESRSTVMDKDRLAAFVDGEMTPEEAARVAIHLADHPQDQAYVDDLMAANAALAQAFGAAMDEPVPQVLRDLILGGPDAGGAPAKDTSDRVVALRRKAPVSPKAVRWGGWAAGAALAAGIALAVVFPAAAPQDLRPGALAADSALHRVLATLPAGEAGRLDDGAEATVLGSVPVPGGFCREVEVIRAATDQLQAALACTAGDGWRIDVVITERLAAARTAEGFGTASGDEAQGFAPFLNRIGAGDFLTPTDEAAAIARGWTP